jgi:hypothetical protein
VSDPDTHPDPATGSDSDIVGRIDALVAEEHALERGETGHPPTAADRARLAEIDVQLDQAWDLLRQRRARRRAGLDPADVHTRPADVVEGYEQ